MAIIFRLQECFFNFCMLLHELFCHCCLLNSLHIFSHEHYGDYIPTISHLSITPTLHFYNALSQLDTPSPSPSTINLLKLTYRSPLSLQQVFKKISECIFSSLNQNKVVYILIVSLLVSMACIAC